MRRLWPCLLLAACDPLWTAEVRVADTSGQPVAGATVTITCIGRQGGVVNAGGRTDANGVMTDSGVGFGLGIPCNAVISHPDHVTVAVPMGAPCEQMLRGSCLVSERDVVVVPR